MARLKFRFRKKKGWLLEVGERDDELGVQYDPALRQYRREVHREDLRDDPEVGADRSHGSPLEARGLPCGHDAGSCEDVDPCSRGEADERESTSRGDHEFGAERIEDTTGSDESQEGGSSVDRLCDGDNQNSGAQNSGSPTSVPVENERVSSRGLELRGLARMSCSSGEAKGED